MEYFEKLPVNDDLREFFENATFADDFYKLREVMDWFYFNCYLTYSENVFAWIEEDMKDVFSLTKDTDSAYYIAECAVPFSCKTGPLALKGSEWLCGVLRANVQDEKAKWVENLDYKQFDIKLIKQQSIEGVYVQCLNGDEFYVKKENSTDMTGTGANVWVASFVKYKDDWYTNGDDFYGKYSKAMIKNIEKAWKQLQSSAEPNEKEIKKLLKDAGGNPFFYFANVDELTFFLKRKFKHPELLLANIDDDAKELLLCIVDNGKDVYILNRGASSFCDVHNLFYSKNKAIENGLEDAFYLPASMLKYAMAHEMLPDVGLNSVYGEERGKQLFRENYDFIYRAVMENDYIDR